MATKAELRASVSLNTSAFSRGIKSLQGHVAGLVRSTGRLTAFAGPLAALFTTGAFAIGIKNAIHLGDELLDASEKTGVATDALGGLKLAAEQTGGSFDTVVRSLVVLRKNAASAIDALGAGKINGTAKTFDDLGVTVADAAGAMRPLDDILADVADAVERAEDKNLALAKAQKVLGKSGADLGPLLRLGSDGIRDFRRQAEALGVALKPDTAAKFKRVADAVLNLKQAIAGAFVRVADRIAPVLENIADAISRLLIDPDAQDAIGRFGDMLADGLKRGAMAAIDLYGWLRRSWDVLKILGVLAAATFRELAKDNPLASEFLETATTNIAGAFKDLLDFAVGIFRRMANEFVAAFKLVAPTIAEVIGSALGAAMDAAFEIIGSNPFKEAYKLDKAREANEAGERVAANKATMDYLRTPEGAAAYNAKKTESDPGLVEYLYRLKAETEALQKAGEEAARESENPTKFGLAHSVARDARKAAQNAADNLSEPFETDTTVEQDWTALLDKLRGRFASVVEKAKGLKGFLSDEDRASIKAAEDDLERVGGTVERLKKQFGDALFPERPPGAGVRLTPRPPITEPVAVEPQTAAEFEAVFARQRQAFAAGIAGIRERFAAGLASVRGEAAPSGATGANLGWVASGFQTAQDRLSGFAEKTAENTRKSLDKLDEVVGAIEDLDPEAVF